MSKEHLKRLAALEARLLRPVFKPFPAAEATRALVAAIDWCNENRKAVQSGRASKLPIRPDTTPDTPAKAAVHRQLAQIHDRLVAGERERRRRNGASASLSGAGDAGKPLQRPCGGGNRAAWAAPLESLPAAMASASNPLCVARLPAGEPDHARQVLPLQ